MNLWILNDKHLVAAETERDAYNLCYSRSFNDASYTEFQKKFPCRHIGEALVGQRPEILLENGE